MEHLILTRTEFFRQINNDGDRTGMDAAYNDFIMAVISLCTEISPSCHPFLTLSYTETELQYHKALQDMGTDHGMYVRKALAFVRKMLKHISMPHSQVPPLSFIPSQDEKKNDIPADAPSMRWTGSTVDLIELLYGLDTLKYINGGETGMGELLGHFSRIFGLEIKDSQCYNTYAAIKGRKNGSRTYFFDRASEKLNQRMVQDEERERMFFCIFPFELGQGGA